MSTALLPQVRLLRVEKILEIHTDLADRYGLPGYGTNPEVRDMEALRRVVSRADAAGGAAQGLAAIAGEYLCGLMAEHPFVDANRRTAAAGALYFLELNGVDAPIDDRLFEEVLAAVAAGRMNRAAVQEFFARFVGP